MNKKLIFIILSLIILTSTLLLTTNALAFVQVFFKEIGPLNLIEGNVLKGNIKVKVSCGGFSQNIIVANASVDFGDGNVNSFGDCSCVSSSTPGTLSPVKEVICEIPFSHIYNASGTYDVKPSAKWNTIVGGVPGSSTRHGSPETVIVVAPPKPGPATTTENPLATTTLSGLIDSISNFVVYIVTGLALLLIMVGGFYIVTSAGKPDQMSTGKKIIVYTIIGYVLIMVARGIINLIFKITGTNISI